MEAQTGRLTSDERSRLAANEAKIERHNQTYYEAGAALEEIRDERLYRESHGTFEDYCQQRWGYSRQRAHQLIDAHRTARDLSTAVDTQLPRSEWQVREINRVEPERRADAWQSAVQTYGEQPTAAQIRQTASPPMLAIVDLETGEIVEDAGVRRGAGLAELARSLAPIDMDPRSPDDARG